MMLEFKVAPWGLSQPPFTSATTPTQEVSCCPDARTCCFVNDQACLAAAKPARA